MNGQHSANYINRLEFEKQTNVTHSIKGCTKVNLNNIYKTPALSLRTSEGDVIWLAAPLGMQVTLADCKHSGNHQRWISPQEVVVVVVVVVV